MIFTDQMKNLKIYQKPMFLPTLEDDKKRKSLVLLLTPNYESSKKLINHQMTINKLRFQSYYMEQDVSYLINGKESKVVTKENYIRENSYNDLYQNLNEMLTKEKARLKDSDFGLPELRKYPIHDEEHVKSAIKFFNYVSKENEKELAENILQKIEEYNMKNITVGKNNRFNKYCKDNILVESTYINSPVLKDVKEALEKEGIKIHLSKNGEWGLNQFNSGVSDIICLGSFKKEEFEKAYKIVKENIPSHKYKVKKDEYFTLFLHRDSSVNESCSINITNSVDNPYISVSAIITNKKGEILLLDHNKCNALTIPGGKVDNNEDIEKAIFRELKEELNIIATDYSLYCENYFICDYPKGSGNWCYFKDYTFVINNYKGYIVNNEPEKHKDILWIDRNELCNNNEYKISDLLSTYLFNWSKNQNDISDTLVDSLSSFIYFSGYQQDVENIRKIITPQVYYNILSKDLQIPILKFEDIPILKITVSNEFKVGEYEEQDGHLVINIEVNKYNMGTLTDYIYSIMNIIYLGIIQGKYPCTRDTVLPYIRSHYLVSLDTRYREWGSYLFNKTIFSNVKLFNEVCNIGDVKSIYEILNKEFQGITINDLYKSDNFTISENRIFIKESAIDINPIKNLYGTINKVEEEFVDYNLFNEINFEDNDEYINLENCILLLQEDSKNDTQLKRIIYNERIKQRGELLAYLKKVKEENSIIKYAYPDLNKYGQKNLFVDLSFYNELFFKNNTWSLNRGYNLYLDLLDRLINNPKFKKSGYEKKTIFIPVLDWDKDKSTKMWIYRESINPISIIYELIRTESARIKKVFGDTDIIFFANNKYFKINFTEIDDIKKSLNKFRMFILNIRSNQEFSVEDIDTSFDNKETPRVIKTNLIDKIEDAKGVDLTGRDKEVKKQNKEINERNNKGRSIREPLSYSDNLLSNNEKDKSAANISLDTQELNLSKDANIDELKRNELEIQKISDAIDRVAQTSDGTEDALDQLDKDDYIKSLIIDLDSMKSDSVKIDPARAARMSNLDNEFLNTEIKGKSIRDLLDPKESNNDLKEVKLNISSPNDEWNSIKYMNFDRDYNLEKDIISCFYHFTKVSKPIAIRKLDITDNSTSEDRLDLYTVDMEDFNGKRFTVKLDIPRMIDNRFLLRGNEKSIQTQLFNMPIIKTELDTCQVVTNYQKIFIRRFNTVSGRSNPYAGKFIKAINKYDGKKIKVSFGDNSKICNKYELPIDYIDLASVLNKIETEKYTIYFNQDEIRDLYPNIDDSYGVPFAVDKEGNIHYYTMYKRQFFIQQLLWLMNDQDFMNSYNSIKSYNGGTYSRCSILNTEIPLVIVCAYVEGLSSVLKKAKINYAINESLSKELKENSEYKHIKFNDGYLSFEITYESCMLLNGLFDCDTESYSITDIDNKNMYIEILDNFGGRIKADGLDNFYDCLIDPITRECLEYYKLPTDFVSILLYANILLCDNKYVKHTDSSSRRIRRSELVAAYTYEVLSEAYALYANSIKHGKSNSVMSVKQSAVIDKILLSPVSSDDSIINALNAVETTNSITFKGKAGLNNDRSYSLDKRTYDNSMLNVLGMSTGFSANVGLTRQATIDMNIEGSRGFIKPIDNNIDKLNAAKTLCATEALTPFGVTRDDAPRTYMTFIQTSKHMVRTEDSDPLLVTNGADEALAYLTIDKFAFKSKRDGKITEITSDYMIIEYIDGEKDYINLKETVEKNSDGGFYVPLKLDKAEGLKVGDKIKQNQILAYDKKSFSNSVGETNNIAYNIGKLAKIAILNTDEGFEDSGICSERLAKQLSTKIIKKVDHVIDKNATVFKIAKVGDKIEVEDNLIVWQDPHEEEEANILLKMLADDQEAVSELGRKTIKSDVSGRIADIKIYRTVEIDELSDSLKKIVKQYEAPIKNLKSVLDQNQISSKSLPATYKLEATGKLKKAQEAIFIEFYLEYPDTIAIGDKITYYSANKAIMKNILSEKLSPYTDFRPNEPVDAFISQSSIDNRMVTSTLVYGSIQKLLIELDRTIKDDLKIPYDDSKV